MILDMIQGCCSENYDPCVLLTANFFFIIAFLNYEVI